MQERRSTTIFSGLLTIIACFFLLSPCWSQRQTGIASYYARRMTGARTASGEPLHHDSMTCAHRTHPFGTLLKVTDQSTQRSVVVRVNDRGPFVRGRIIDLSWGAAKDLGIILKGVAKVTVEPTTSYPYIILPIDTLQRKVEIPSLYDELELEELPLILPPLQYEQ